MDKIIFGQIVQTLFINSAIKGAAENIQRQSERQHTVQLAQQEETNRNLRHIEEALYGLGAQLQAISSEISSQLERLIAAASQSDEEKRRQEKIEEAQRLIEISTSDSSHARTAVRFLNEVWRTKPSDPTAPFLICAALLQIDDAKASKTAIMAAERGLKTVHKIEPEELASHISLGFHIFAGFAYQRLGHEEKANLHFSKACKLEPTNIVARYFHAISCVAIGNTSAATSSILAACLYEPEFVGLFDATPALSAIRDSGGRELMAREVASDIGRIAEQAANISGPKSLASDLITALSTAAKNVNDLEQLCRIRRATETPIDWAPYFQRSKPEEMQLVLEFYDMNLSFTLDEFVKNETEIAKTIVETAQATALARDLANEIAAHNLALVRGDLKRGSRKHEKEAAALVAQIEELETTNRDAAKSLRAKLYKG